VDDEFMRYLLFAIEVCEWHEGRSGRGTLESRAERIFGRENPKAQEHLDLLFDMFDTWVDNDVNEWLAHVFSSSSDAGQERLTLFGPDSGLTLFERCCHTYGDVTGNRRRFDLGQTMMLLALIVHRLHNTADLVPRLRVLRNLIAASTNEIRLDNMPALVGEAEQFMLHGDLDVFATFNQVQVGDERAKQAFLDDHPELANATHALEDVSVLQGALGAFALDASRLEVRGQAFRRLMSDSSTWRQLTAAILAQGEYARPRGQGSFQFGSPENERGWRDLLTGRARPSLGSTRNALQAVLDAVATSDDEPAEVLRRLRQEWVAHREEERLFDWRYYLVKYDAMREGRSGIYASAGEEMGFDVCMLDKTQLNSNYRDPFLSAVVREAGAERAVKGETDGPRFTGYASRPRWMELKKSGAAMRCVSDGFELRAPEGEHRSKFNDVVAEHAGPDAESLLVPQIEDGGHRFDTVDRVEKGASLLRALVAAGL
jgi:hypothetical protein